MKDFNNPFPGLQAYELNDAKQFIGREPEIETLLSTLKDLKFVIISGASGSGKTSVLNAGILPKIQNGFVGQVGREWSICHFRPGIAPLEQFCFAMADQGIFYSDRKSRPTDKRDYLSVFDNKKELGLIDLYNQSELAGSDQNLIFIIDQLEDIFKFSSFYDVDQQISDDLFFNIIQRTTRQKDVPIYFLLAIQTEYITKLNSYGRFVELLNTAQFNLPYFNSEKIKALVECTFHQRNVQISEEVIDYFGDLLKENPHYLPHLQYIFKDLYQQYASEISKTPVRIALEQVVPSEKSPYWYLHRKLDNFYKALESSEQQLIQYLFRGLFNEDSTSTKAYYQKFQYLSDYCGIPEKLRQLIDKIQREISFAVDHVNSLPKSSIGAKPPQLKSSDILYLRYKVFEFWGSVQNWHLIEFDHYNLFKDLASKASRYPQESYLTSSSLQRAMSWKNDDWINAKWAKKYDFDFGKTFDYVEASDRANQKVIQKTTSLRKDISRARKRLNRIVFISLGIVLLLLVAMYVERHQEAVKEKNQRLELVRKEKENRELIEKQAKLLKEIQLSNQKMIILKKADSLKYISIIQQLEKKN